MISRRRFVLSGAIWPIVRLSAQDEAQDEEAVPFVEVDKPVFVQSEAIRIWVGVRATRFLTDDEQKPGVLHITRPDGTRESQPVSWPMDGPPGAGWKGGASLGPSRVVTGRYRARFEWGGKQSPEVELTVREWDLADRIRVGWRFDGYDFQNAAARLTVENGADRILRFVHPGVAGADVWVSCDEASDPPSRQSVVYPAEELMGGTDYPGGLADEVRWGSLDQVPLVGVQPFGLFSRVLPLSKAPLVFPVRAPRVEINTVLTVFVGERGDEDSALYPVRLAVREEVRLAVRGEGRFQGVLPG